MKREVCLLRGVDGFGDGDDGKGLADPLPAAFKDAIKLSGGGVFRGLLEGCIKLATVCGPDGIGEAKRLLPFWLDVGFLELEVTGRKSAAIITRFSSHPADGVLTVR